MTRRVALLVALAASACSHRPAPTPPAAVHYVIGPAWEAGGVWHYPREAFDLEATGLAERLPDRRGPTADGELFDPSALTGAHATSQLPAIATVTNLDNGRQVSLRLNDRGPANPNRLLGLSRRAADLLGLPASGATPVRLQIESGPSQALRDRLGGGPRGIVAAPRERVIAEPLGGSAPAAALPAAMATTASDAVPDRMPEQVRQVAVAPGQLWIDAGRFSQERYAGLVAQRLAGLPVAVRREPGARAGFVVRAGPFGSVSAADAALDRARAGGVTDATIVVE